MLTNAKTVLFIGAHPDDEFACSATLAKLVDSGVDIHMVYFSICEDIVPPGFDKNVRISEINEAVKILGVSKDNLYLYTFPVRRLEENKLDIRQRMHEIGQRVKPNLVLTPSRFDVHQDHKAITEEAIRVFKFKSILGYEMVHNNFGSNYNYFVSISDQHLSKKILSIAKHVSENFRKYFDPELIEALARVRGLQAGVDLAEAFELIKMVED